MSREMATIRFIDAETNDEGVVIVRTADGYVGLAVSLQADGDIQVFLEPAVCEQVVAALRSALVAVANG